jgi:hypothetical protein
MADCCDNCRQGKVCCSILDKQGHDHDHSHPAPSAAPSRSRGGSPRTRRMAEAVPPRQNPDTSPVIDMVAAKELHAEQTAAAARSSALARPNPAPSGMVLSPEQKKWAIRIAAGAAIIGGAALGYYGLKRAGKI